MRVNLLTDKRWAGVILAAGLLIAPCGANAAKSTAKAKQTASKPAPLPPDDLTPVPIRHVAVCPPPKIAPCVVKRPIPGGYRVLTSGVEIADDGSNWIVDFGKGPKGSMFLLQVLESGGALHEIEVSFRTKPGMQKTPTLPAE